MIVQGKDIPTNWDDSTNGCLYNPYPLKDSIDIEISEMDMREYLSRLIKEDKG